MRFSSSTHLMILLQEKSALCLLEPFMWVHSSPKVVYLGHIHTDCSSWWAPHGNLHWKIPEVPTSNVADKILAWIIWKRMFPQSKSFKWFNVMCSSNVVHWHSETSVLEHTTVTAKENSCQERPDGACQTSRQCPQLSHFFRCNTSPRTHSQGISHRVTHRICDTLKMGMNKMANFWCGKVGAMN